MPATLSHAIMMGEIAAAIQVFKFIYSEKATKFSKISTVDLTVTT